MIKPKLVIIGTRGIPAISPGTGGIDTYVENQLSRLSSKYHITLLTRSWVRNQTNDYPNVHIPCLKGRYLDTGIYTILSTLTAIFINPDIYWYHAPGSALLSFIPKLLGKKVILTIHGVDWQREKWKLPFEKIFLHLLEIIAIKSADQIYVVSPNLVKYIYSSYHRQATVALPNISPTRTATTSCITKIGLKKNRYILYLGRLVPEKRVDWLIKSYLSNTNVVKQYKLVISGSIDNSQYCHELLTNRHPQIIFTDYVTGQTKQELLNHCRLFVLPSSLEGNSISLNEALSLGKKCLGSDIPPNQELAKKYPNLALFKHNSIKNLSSKLSKL